MNSIEAFRSLHQSGFFVMPNAWDIGSAVRLEAKGFSAIATTSSGHAASLGLLDQEVNFEQLCVHVEQVVRAVSVPVSVDSEQLFGTSSDEITANTKVLAGLGAAGISVEDYNPKRDEIESIEEATERVGAAAEGAKESGMVLTARSENHLYGHDNLDDTIARLVSYGQAGADVLYAPGLVRPDQIARVVAEVGRPVNVLLMPAAPGLGELAELGVRRVSTGGGLANVAYGAAMGEADKLVIHQD